MGAIRSLIGGADPDMHGSGQLQLTVRSRPAAAVIRLAATKRLWISNYNVGKRQPKVTIHCSTVGPDLGEFGRDGVRSGPRSHGVESGPDSTGSRTRQSSI